MQLRLPLVMTTLALSLVACSADTPDAEPVAAGEPTAAAEPSEEPLEEPSPSAPPPAKGTPVVAASLPERAEPLTPEPGRDASPEEQIGYELQKRTVRTAGIAAKTTSSCAGEFGSTPTLMCTVDYAGVKVPWTVTVKSSGSIVSSYTAETTKGVLVPEFVLQVVGSAGGFDQRIDPVCDLPAGPTLVDLDTPSGATCSYRLKVDPDTLRVDDVVLTEVQVSTRMR